MTGIPVYVRRAFLLGWKAMKSLVLPVLLILLGLLPLRAQDAEPGGGPLNPSERLRWQAALAAHDKARDAETDWHSPAKRRAVEGGIACALKLWQWDDALQRAQTYIENVQGTYEEAVGWRLLGGLHLLVAHDGRFVGGKWRRQLSEDPFDSGSTVFFAKDRREAIRCYERARELLIGLIEQPERDPDRSKMDRPKLFRAERIGVNFDLAAALTKSPADPFHHGLSAWYWRLSSSDPGDDLAALPPEDPADEVLPSRGSSRDLEYPKPQGIPLGTNGQPQFLQPASVYSAALGDGLKIRFLLEEIASLDDSADRNESAAALLRRSQIARSLFEHNQDTHERPREAALLKPVWELADNEVITYLAGQLKVVALPPAESPIALLRMAAEKFPNSPAAREAESELADIFESRLQFGRALEIHRRLLSRNPKDRARRIAEITRPEVVFQSTGVHYPGAKPKLAFTYRNAGIVEYKAFRFDLPRYVREQISPKGSAAKSDDYHFSDWRSSSLFEKDQWRAFAGPEVARWRESVSRPDDHRSGSGSTAVPLVEPGAWVIEANTPGATGPTRILLLISDTALVQKSTPQGRLIWLTDAKSGQPLAGRRAEIFEQWNDGFTKARRQHVAQATSDADGLIEYSAKDNGSSRICTVVADGHGGMAFSFLQQNSSGLERPDEAKSKYYVMTDRPVYRPGSTVRFRIWARERRNGQYQPPKAGEKIRYAIYPDAKRVLDFVEQESDATGGVSGEFVLGPDAKLGFWHIEMPNGDSDGYFRVEEYRKPEFEVTVKPATGLTRLGEKIKATVSARYYFGQPVAHGTVSYRVFREEYRHAYDAFGPFGWLYGLGYGRCFYGYEWLGWNEPAGPRLSQSRRELISEGTASLRPDGTFELEIDSGPAKAARGDRDHIYLIEVGVRDASRRVIEARGSVIVTRQEFSAFLETDCGWYRPAQDARIEVRTLTAENVPVAVRGEMAVTRIRFGATDPRDVREELVQREEVQTDAEGRLSFRCAVPGEGQYRVRFRTHDSAKSEITAEAVFWASGPKFDGREYRFRALEIITDKRSYRVGETARLLINTAESDSHVLVSTNGYSGLNAASGKSWSLLRLPTRTTVVEVPIEARHIPNFFVEAALVRDGRIHEETREVIVPPERSTLGVTVQAEHPTYAPGAPGKVRVTARDSAGQPVTGEMVLSVFDESLLAIQPDDNPSPREVFFGDRRRRRDRSASTSLALEFSGSAPIRYSAPWRPRNSWEMEGSGLRLGGSPIYRKQKRPDLRGAMEPEHDDRADRRRAGLPGLISPSSEYRPARVIVTGSYIPVEDSQTPTSAYRAGPEPKIRADFSDTALWLPRVMLNAEGVGEAEVTFPESLTTWRLRAHAITPATEVGAASGKAITTKPFLVRLQSPRFFVERDEVVLSANVHNGLGNAQDTRAELLVPAALFEPLDEAGKALPPDADGFLHLTAQASVPANGEHRFDWPLRVRKPGLAQITVKAIGADASDAMRLAFPVLVHGIQKQLTQSGSLLAAKQATRTLTFTVPAEAAAGQTRLELTLSPSLASVMIDALPYLIAYPHGCTEQTMSRFYPSVVVAGALKKLGTDLEAVGRQRRQMNAGDLTNRFGPSPVFDSAELARMTKAGCERIAKLQQSNGGWGWWSDDAATPYQTAYVLEGLIAARKAGVEVDPQMLARGFAYLKNHVTAELAKPPIKRELGDETTQAYLAYVLGLDPTSLGEVPTRWLNALYAARERLNPYGASLLALALHGANRRTEAAAVLRTLLLAAQRDDSNETAWIGTVAERWWFWWNNDIETNARALRALVVIDRKNPLAPRLVKWLLNNRRGGHYWRGTRDTALTITALSEFFLASGEAAPDYTLSVRLDGGAAKEIRVTKENFFSFENRLIFPAGVLAPGTHTITLTKSGKGALYYAAALSYFTTEEDAKGAGGEIAVRRDYFKLVPETAVVQVPDPTAALVLPAGQTAPPGAGNRTEKRSGYRRESLKNGDAVASGDLIEVVLTVTAKNTYDYLAFEDPKPAGCEPIELRSGSRWADGLCSSLELRDTKVAFFIGLLPQGEHVLRYKLRAETPGHFHALPTAASAMYAPEIQATSDEHRLRVR